MAPPKSLSELRALDGPHYDWPAPGKKVTKMSEIDLPYESSGAEWWYYNFHLTLEDGSQASAFIAFFRTSTVRPTENELEGRQEGEEREEVSTRSEERCNTHLVHFAISLSPSSEDQQHIDPTTDSGRYLFTSAMDSNNASYLLSMLDADDRVDPLLKRSLSDLLRSGKVPEPDVLLPKDSVRVCDKDSKTLDLKYGDIASVVRIASNKNNESGNNEDVDADVYHIVANSVDGSYGFELDLIPRKPPVNHGADGVVVGDHVTPEDAMYYCFVPRCEVSGSLRVDGLTRRVVSQDSLGWYDREFGGSIRTWYQPPVTVTESSWHWGSAQLKDGRDLTWYTLWDVDVHTGEKVVRDKRALVIDALGGRSEYGEHSFVMKESWTSIATLNEYGTRWKLDIPEAEVELVVEAPFSRQELRSICATRGYWEGRVEVSGVIGGEKVTGLGFVENLPAQLITKFEKYLKRVGQLTSKEVSRIYPPSLLDAKHTADVLILETPSSSTHGCKDTMTTGLDTERFTRDIHLDVLYEHFFAPVRHLTSQGGKSWRSYVGIVCMLSLGSEAEHFKPILAATELLHTGSLIIDDIQDGSPMRRGVSSVHNVWGVPTAINAGTAAYFAFDTAMRGVTKHLRPDQVLAIYEIYFETMRAAHVGQALDIAGQQRSDLEDVLSGQVDPSVLEKRVLAVHRLKTAIIAANIAKIAAVLADAGEREMSGLTKYFEQVGIAFQIIDDVYDLRGWSHVLGSTAEKREELKNTNNNSNKNGKKDLKRRGDDIRSGKINIPIAKAGSMMPLEEARWIWDTVLAKPGEDDVLTHEVIDKLEKYGVVDECVRQAHEMVDRSWEELDPVLRDSHSKVALKTLGWYLVKYNSI
ncbi:terpenoid synthase [Dendrothele bispora CBS 962.96]|uniref:(2E,6E)-farnesyl diphosphate synthase n=1 Tax=Dendrothele bispora (strain CBS 962.96) TaxID=1314807 RepID=A0A4S8LAA5_DENBC|nr:terpenoid synthase [Dendrothele bispora CBS 962.96]